MLYFVLSQVALGAHAAFAGHIPMAATDVAASWDSLYIFLIALSTFFFVLVVGGMLYLAIRYRHKPGIKTKYITDNHFLEAFWTVVPTILLMIIFGWGWNVYLKMTNAPSDAYEVRVIGKQWLWQFQYDHGVTTIGELYVPIGKPVKLIMTSTDVIHSFFVPNFRVKQDVVPGMYTSVWFEAKVPGKHQVYCTEYCGTSHSGMLAQVIVLEDKDWKLWLRGKDIGPQPIAGMTLEQSAIAAVENAPVVSLAEKGKALAQSKGCVACHSDDGSAKVGPSYKGIFGHDVELADGSKVKVDENYLRESIENPTAKIVKGFAPSMPTFKGLLKEEELGAIISYIKSLR